MPTYATPPDRWWDIQPTTRTITSAETLTAADDLVLVDVSGGAFSVTLPPASVMPGKEFRVAKSDTSTDAVTLDANGAETIAGTTTRTILRQWDLLRVQSTGTGWVIVGEHREPAYASLRVKNGATGFAATTSYQLFDGWTELGPSAGCSASLSTEKITIDADGDYLCWLFVDDYTITANTAVQFELFKNGSELDIEGRGRSTGVSIAAGMIGFQAILAFSADDTIDVRVLAGSAQTLTVIDAQFGVKAFV